ncbi:MAG TPA: OmpA family protein [Treponemataceae bacterium]|nr:OmpA family protein [Treponemataceae bacterium]
MTLKQFPVRFLHIIFLIFLISTVDAQEKYLKAQSSIDWKTEKINSTLSLDAKKTGITLPSGRNAALQMLEMETPALLKDTFFSLLINSSSRLGDSIARGDVSLADLNRIIDQGIKTPPWFSQDLKQVSMTHTITLQDIGELFIRHDNAYENRPPLEKVATRSFSGILIDARGSLPVHGEYTEATLEPCLFPRIWNNKMELLYEKNLVDPKTAKQQGIVYYSASSDESIYRDRIGTDPLRITAREVFGQNRTDPIISSTDYLRIMSDSKNRALLTAGKLVILCNEDALKAGQLGPKKDENYYFAWHDIGSALSVASVSKIDFTDSWKGLKLTIYDIRFIADTAQILPDERSRLDSIASALALAGKTAHFKIDGHTASVGKPEGEMILSIQRAETIARELSIRGIISDKIQTAGFGGTQPVASNDTDQGRALNRRVEITIEMQD